MTPSSKSAAEGPSANAGTAVNADAAPVKRYSLFTAICTLYPGLSCPLRM